MSSTLGSLLRTARRLPSVLRSNRQSAFFTHARRWSNRELERIAPLFDGPVLNVSAWADSDKEGRCYRDYFPSGTDYWISNFGTSQGEMQGSENEFFLDLEADLPADRKRRFATVFNHTTLEHIWDFRKAFANLCELSNDAVIIIVPWLQPLHADYGDYWRFSPQAVIRLFEEQSMHVVHIDWNRAPRQSVYVLAVAVRDPKAWASKFAPFPPPSSDPSFFAVSRDSAGHQAFDL